MVRVKRGIPIRCRTVRLGQNPPMLRKTFTVGDTTTAVYKYGNTLSTPYAEYLTFDDVYLPKSFWGDTYSYAKWTLSKITVVIFNIRLFAYFTSDYDKSDIGKNNLVVQSNDNQTFTYFMELRGDDNTLINLDPNHSDQLKQHVYRKGKRHVFNVYCKPKNYINTTDNKGTINGYKKQMGCVYPSKIFFGPCLVSDEPDKADENMQLCRQMSIDYKIHFTYTLCARFNDLGRLKDA